MRIGIDARTILNPEKGEAGGIGHYTYQLLLNLIKVDKKNNYVIFFDRSVQKKILLKFVGENIEIKFFPYLLYKKFLFSIYGRFLETAFIEREKLDVFYSPVPYLPLNYKGRAIVSVHDLSVLKYPEWHPPSFVKESKKIVPQSLSMAKKIIAVSNSIKDDLIDLFKISKKKIAVIYQGLDKRFFDRVSAEEKERVKKKFNIKKDYILFMGTLEPRKKNLLALVEVFETINKKKRNFQLVLAGKRGFEFKKLEQKINESKFKNDIILPGYIEADDLNGLFQAAKIFVYPCFYAGFALVILEAFASELPAVASRIPAITEVIKDEAILVNPKNLQEMVEGIEKIIEEENLRAELKEKGLKRAKNFDWGKCALETVKILEDVSKI